MLLAGSGLVEYSRLTPEVREQLLRIIDKLAPRFDRILLDTGAGISDVVLYAVSLADEVLVIATPEPTSMTDAYATIKGARRRSRAGATIRAGRQPGQRASARGATIRNQLQLVVDRFVTPARSAEGAGAASALELLGEIPTDLGGARGGAAAPLLLGRMPGSPRRRSRVAAIAGRMAA